MKTPRKAASKKPVPESPRRAPAFPVVGIGASAGGLETLEAFLHNVPAGCGMAFVIVQHLDPTHKGMMPELLQRATSMKVTQVKDRTPLRPDCVYVIPPNKDLSVLHGVLHLLDPVAPRGLRLPIDFFFRSLADDAEEHSVGVILSGMGSDGTLGLKAIKGKAGGTFVQDPATARFDGMPRSAVDAGVADIVAPVETLPGRILSYLKHVPLVTGPRLADDTRARSAFEKIVILLRTQTGQDFSLYKKNTVYRRIERRMGIQQIERIDDYVKFLRDNAHELNLLFKELLIGVTSFFRDPAAWEQMRTRVVPALLKNRAPGQPMRVWCPACSTGEEAYSLAIIVREALEEIPPPRRCPVQVFATDLDREAIDRARAGVFPANIGADLTPERLGRFFVKVDEGYRVSQSIRESVTFAPQNVIMNPPFTKLDIISCRNLLIYLTPELQDRLLALFHFSLSPGGFLFLGSSETVSSLPSAFALMEGAGRIYRRLEGLPPAGLVAFTATSPLGAPATQEKLVPPGNLPAQAERLLLESYAPPAVLVNAQGDILFISGRTGKYLEPVAGKVNWNILAMAREGLRREVGEVFRKALRTPGTVVRKAARVRTEKSAQAVECSAEALVEPEALRGMVMVVFRDAVTVTGARELSRRGPPGGRHKVLERENERLSQELRATREEAQMSQEELKSTNEEFQSVNEELQSTNEELTTSKEEMQSMNEELQTLNHELQAKMDHLSRLNDDLKNLLDSTEIATLFVDTSLRIRLFTPGSNRIFRLIPGDVGRPITDIASQLEYPDLAHDAAEVLRTLVVRELAVAARDGAWFQVRIMPYRTSENVIAGTVITFTNITASKTLEAELRATQAKLEGRIAAHTRQDPGPRTGPVRP